MAARHPGGRPTDYTPELAERICDVTATTIKSVYDICKSNNDFPDECTVFRWMRKYPKFRQDYLEAKELQGLLYSDKVMRTIWDCDEVNESIAKANLILRGAQWHLSKLAPKQFGDKTTTESKIEVTVHEDALKDLK